MSIFKRKKKFKTDDEIAEHLLSLTDGGDYGIFPPPTNTKVAINELISFFLDKNWYSVNPMSSEQIITEALFEIEMRHKKLYKRKDKTNRRYTIREYLENIEADDKIVIIRRKDERIILIPEDVYDKYQK